MGVKGGWGPADRFWMGEALRQAQVALALGEVPVGAVLVHGERLLAASGNRRERWQDPTAHAELIALREASRLLGSWRLEGATLYVTLEPCAMCAGAIVLSRVTRVVYGAADPKAGAVASLYQLLADERLNHRPEVRGGLCEEESGELLRGFFRRLRDRG